MSSWACDEQRVKRGAARSWWSWSHPAERTARRRRRDTENTSKNTHLGRLRKLTADPRSAAFFLTIIVLLLSTVEHADARRQRQELEWETNEKRAAQRPNYGSKQARRKALPVRLSGAGCSAGWEVCCAPASVRPGRNITWQAALPLEAQKQTPSLLSGWKVEAGNGSAPPCVQCASFSRTLLSAFPPREPLHTPVISHSNLGQLWPPDYPRWACWCLVSMQGAQWASRARLQGLLEPRWHIQSPAKSSKVSEPTHRRCRSGGAMWLRRTPSWTPSSGSLTVKVRPFPPLCFISSSLRPSLGNWFEEHWVLQR